MRSKTVKRIAFAWMGVVMMMFLTGCFGSKYTVTSENEFLTGLGEYRKGDKVEVVLEMWATDTDYTFFVDGEPANVSFEYGRGYIIGFTMPAHDVRVTYEARNSMVGE